MRSLFLLCSLVASLSLSAQELFVFTEPASNMPAKSIGLRLDNYFTKESKTARTAYALRSELMFALSRKFMLHADMSFSNRTDAFSAKAFSLYGKYRFYSTDEVHSHFRIAAFARWSNASDPVLQEAIDLYGLQTGEEAGIVATKLINKLALSASSSFMHTSTNDALAFSFSTGKLLLPRKYTSYNQPNLNGMIEVLGQTNLHYGKTYLDIAPSLQLILFSRMRLDIGYKIAVVKDLYRAGGNSALLRLEYTFFNAFR